MTNSELQVLRPQQVCEILGNIHISTLYRWIDEGKFPLQKVQLGPRAVGFKKEDVEAYINGEYEEESLQPA